MTFKPGEGGRPKGSPNKTSSAVKDAVAKALLRLGGEDYLVRVAETDPRTFCTLLAKLLPNQLASEEGVPATFTIVTGVPASPETRSRALGD